MIVKTADELSSIVKRIIMVAGADERNANRLAEALVSANLSGVNTHGVYKVLEYADSIKSGRLIPTAWPEVITETENSALVKGNWTFGQVTAKFAMEIAIEKAKKNNISIVSAVQVTHTGRLGEYAEMAAAEKMISFMFSGGYSEETPSAMPYGGVKRVLHTNPCAMGFPDGDEGPMIADFATTVVSGTKIDLARDRKEELPPGCIVDKEGRPTRSPLDFFEGGGHVPFGGHKGYAIMLANEFLGGIFSRAKSFAKKGRGGPVLGHSGFTMVVFRSDLFSSFEEYTSSMDEMERRVRKVPPAPGFKEVLIPGDMEERIRRQRMKNGIPIAENVWKSLDNLAKSLGIERLQ